MGELSSAETKAHAATRGACLPRPLPLAQHKWPPDVMPTLSICSLAYNHAPFIRECLDGFLMQETDFPVEIVIHDDASTDGTAAVIREYEARYPNLFRPIYQSENQYSKGVKPIFQYLLPNVRGKYIAICEGDDYWTDPRKLQIQVDFLDSHPDYVMCYHDALMVSVEGTPMGELKPRGDFTAAELMAGAYALTATRCYRNVLTDYPFDVFNQILNGDVLLSVLLGRHGHGKYLPQIRPAGYRQHDGGIWSSLGEQDRHFRLFNSCIRIYQYLLQTDGKDVASEFLLQSVFPIAAKLFPERNPVAGEVERLAGIVARRDEQLRRKDEIIAAAHAQLRDLRESRTYRVGSALVGPLRKVLDALRGSAWRDS